MNCQRLLLVFIAVWLIGGPVASAAPPPELVRDGFTIDTVVAGLREPTGLAWIDTHTMLVLEKTGTVRIVRDRKLLPEPALRLPVNFVSERGLLGIAVHPRFAANSFVYLCYTDSASGFADGHAEQTSGHRVVRYTWHHDQLVSPQQIIAFPYRPKDKNGPHENGGKIIFGPDGKLYGVIGSQQRRGLEQNETGDDQSTASTNSGGIFRLNDDGTIPKDNPWADSPDPAMHKWFAVGIRNSFGLAFDPVTHMLWDTENGEHLFDEINRVPAKFNSGWTAIMGPSWHRDNKGIHVDRLLCGQQLLGAQYHDPVFSWYRARGLCSIAFLAIDKYRANSKNGVVVGEINAGWLFYFPLNAKRNGFDLHSKALDDLVVEGDLPADILENEKEIMLATHTGGITDIQIGPDGLAYMTSFYNGCVYVLKATR